ncbi:MAG: cation:proton antiporter [Acidimicrobiia bacterium]
MPNLTITEQNLIGLLVIAAVVGIAVSYLRIPYTIALVGVGLFLGFGDVIDLNLTRDLILLGILPPLLFEGALNIDLDDLRRRWLQVGMLAVVGTLVVMAALTGGFLLLGFRLPEAVLMGVIIAPTDPVSVLAVFKEYGVGTGLRTLMEGESIFNDAIAIVLYLLAVDVVEGSSFSVQSAAFQLGVELVAGVVVGVVVGIVAQRLMSAVDNHLIEITLSLTSAFGAYLLADTIGGSGVIATVAAGLVIGNYGTRSAMSASSRIALYDFWGVLAFLANSIMFLLIGVSFDVTQLVHGSVAAAIGVAFLAMTLGRAAVTYGLMRPFVRSEGQGSISPPWLHAIFWGGLRGAIPIALVLGLSDRTLGGVDAAVVVFGVVLISLLGQGLTFRPLLSRLDLIGPGHDIEQFEEAYARSVALRSSLDELNEMRRRGEVVKPIYENLRDGFQEELNTLDERMRQMALDSDATRARQVQRVARRLATAQRTVLADFARRGVISQQVSDRLRGEIDSALDTGASDPSGAADITPGLYPRPEEEGEEEGDPEEGEREGVEGPALDDVGQDAVSGEGS